MPDHEIAAPTLPGGAAGALAGGTGAVAVPRPGASAGAAELGTARMVSECGAIRVLLAEDMRILRDTLAALLLVQDDIDLVAEVADGPRIVSTVAAYRPNVAVIDIDLPGMDGLTVAAQLRDQFPECKVLILTVLANPRNLRRALAAQVAGFLPKDTTAAAGLLRAIRKIAAGERVIEHGLALKSLEVPDSPLASREADVLRQYAAGLGPADIAVELHLAYGTVRNYLASAVTKLGARSRVDAVRIATDAGWL